MWGMRAQKPIAFAFVNLRDAPFFLKVLYNLFFFPKCHGNDNCHDRSMLFFMTSVWKDKTNSTLTKNYLAVTKIASAVG